MKSLRVCIIASTLLLLVLPVGLHAEEAGNRVLTSELVVTNAGRNQFRLVGHGGSFTAPAGIPVETLDGKPVLVEFAPDGRVLRISEQPVPISGIAHSEEVISGQFVVRDPVARTFSFASDDRIYIAPLGMDIRPYSGQVVEVRLDEQGQVADITFAKHSPGVPRIGTPCVINGQRYSDGTSVCQSGMQYRCDLGVWRGLGATCAAGGAASVPSSHGCMIGWASVANGSSVCRSGTTFRCSDGNWVNVGTACS
jgi:hypothetical protein